MEIDQPIGREAIILNLIPVGDWINEDQLLKAYQAETKTQWGFYNTIVLLLTGGSIRRMLSGKLNNRNVQYKYKRS